jgi:hypothetical protein
MVVQALTVCGQCYHMFHVKVIGGGLVIHCILHSVIKLNSFFQRKWTFSFIVQYLDFKAGHMRDNKNFSLACMIPQIDASCVCMLLHQELKCPHFINSAKRFGEAELKVHRRS